MNFFFFLSNCLQEAFHLVLYVLMLEDYTALCQIYLFIYFLRAIFNF